MRKTLWIALAAAASVMPALALAQDHDDWRGRHGGDRQSGQPQRGNGGARGTAPASQAQPQAQPQAQQQPQAQPRSDGRGNAGWAGRRGGDPAAPAQANTGQGRGFGGWRGQGNAGAGVDVQAQARADAQARSQADARARQNGGNWRGGDPRNGYGRPEQGYGRPEQGYGRPEQGYGRPEQGYRQPDRANNGGNGYRPNGNGYRPQGNSYRGDDRGRGDNWNRNWRGNGQYNWQGYRNQNRSIFRLPRYYAPYGWSYGYRRFSIGLTLDRLLFSESYWIDDPYEYRLPEAYGEYRWVRYYNDALLVDIYTGEVVDTVYDIFY